MTDWKQYLKKQGGFALIRQYFKNHTALIALNQFLFVGHDKKALEILRLSVEHKFYRRISKKFKSIAQELVSSYNNSQSQQTDNPVKRIWICWWQGIDNAPDLVRKCYDSVKANFSDWEINVITDINYSNFVTFPDDIIKKWHNGQISNTHMSDLLRIELLLHHGGLWIDSTVFCSSPNIPQSIVKSDLFYYQCLKPGADGHIITMSSWLMYAKANNCIIQLTRDLLYKYWSTHDSLDEYFLLHYFFTLSCSFYPEIAKTVPKFTSSTPHILLLSIFDKFDPVYYNDLCKATCFHKLSYKLDFEKIKNSAGTYYSHIINLPI